MRKTGGLRKRWLMNTVGVVFTLGMLCVLAVLVAFTVYYYNGMVSDMSYRAETTTEFFADYMNQNYKDYYQSCINYANSFEDKNDIELQFINADKKLVATSYGGWAEQSPQTSDITDALQTREISPYIGLDPITGERIIAVSSPMLYSNGEVIGVLRYVTSTRLLDRQIMVVACYAFIGLLAVVLILLFSSNYYIRSILIPVKEITEKAKALGPILVQLAQWAVTL